MNMDAQMTATIPPQDFDPIKQSSPPTPSLSPSLSFPNSSAEQESEHSQSSVILEATFPANAPTFERLLNSRKRNFDDVFGADDASQLFEGGKTKIHVHKDSRTSSPVKVGSSNATKVDSASPIKPQNTHFPPFKRRTPATQALSTKKLSTPFRSPLISSVNAPSSSKPVPSPIKPSRSNVSASLPGPSSTILRHKQVNVLRPFPGTAGTASKAFKSPFSTSSKSAKPSSAFETGPNIAALERQVQLLKQAVKIKNDGSEQKLEQLAKKWKTVARDAAEDVWCLVKENGTAGESAWPQDKDDPFATDTTPGGFDSNWGWGEANADDSKPYEEPERDIDVEGSPPSPSRLLPPRKASTTADAGSSRPRLYRASSFSFADEPEKRVEAEAEDRQETSKEWTLGTMLSVMGIEKELLGWDEEEGEFVDK